MTSLKPGSSEQVPRTFTDGTLTEREQNSTEQIQNGYRMGMERERERNGYGTDTEWERVCM